MTTRIYMAAPLARAAKARDLAARLKAVGFSIVSTWHAVTASGAVDPTDAGERRRILLDCFRELDSADMVVAYLAGPEPPRTTYAEIGYALALNKPVVMALPPGVSVNRCILDAHPLVTTYTSDELLEPTVAKVVAHLTAIGGGT